MLLLVIPGAVRLLDKFDITSPTLVTSTFDVLSQSYQFLAVRNVSGSARTLSVRLCISEFQLTGRTCQGLGATFSTGPKAILEWSAFCEGYLSICLTTSTSISFCLYLSLSHLK